MLTNPVLDVAFVVAATAFFKAQLGLEGRLALLCAFVLSLIVALAPVASAAFPTISPWVNAVIGVVALFVGSAGSYNAIKAFIEISQGVKNPPANLKK